MVCAFRRGMRDFQSGASRQKQSSTGVHGLVLVTSGEPLVVVAVALPRCDCDFKGVVLLQCCSGSSGTVGWREVGGDGRCR